MYLRSIAFKAYSWKIIQQQGNKILHRTFIQIVPGRKAENLPTFRAGHYKSKIKINHLAYSQCWRSYGYLKFWMEIDRKSKSTALQF